jgi:hypothetical protein
MEIRLDKISKNRWQDILVFLNYSEMLLLSQICKHLKTSIKKSQIFIKLEEENTIKAITRLHYFEPSSEYLYLYYIMHKKSYAIKLNKLLPEGFDSIEISQNRLFLMGGQYESVLQTKTYEIYINPNLEEEKPQYEGFLLEKCDVPFGIQGQGLVSVFNQFIYSVGGCEVPISVFINKCAKYDVLKDKWNVIPFLNFSKRNACMVFFKTKSAKGDKLHLYAFGGSPYLERRRVERFNIKKEENPWKLIEIAEDKMSWKGNVNSSAMQV